MAAEHQSPPRIPEPLSRIPLHPAEFQFIFLQACSGLIDASKRPDWQLMQQSDDYVPLYDFLNQLNEGNSDQPNARTILENYQIALEFYSDRKREDV